MAAVTNPYGTDPGAPSGDPYTDAYLQLIFGGGNQPLGMATPTLYGSQYGMFGGMVPEDEDALEYNRDATNYVQDRLQMFADPLVGAMAGGGAYSPAAFTPITKTTQYTSPELDQFMSYLRNPQSYMGFIANKLQNEGVTAEEAIGELRLLVEENPDSPETQALRAQMPHPQADPFSPTGGIEAPDQIDWGKVTEDARFVAGLYFEIPTEGPYEQQVDADGNIISSGGERYWTYDEQGNPLALMQTSIEPTETMEDYDRLGLSYPNEQFTAEMLMGPEQAGAIEQFSGPAAEQIDPRLPLVNEAGAAPMNEAMLQYLAANQAVADYQPRDYTHQLATRGAAADVNAPRYDFPTGLNPPGGDVVAAPGPSNVSTTVNQLLPHDPGALSEYMRFVYPTLDRTTQDSMAQYLTSTGQGDVIPAQPRSVMTQGGQPLAAPDILPQDPGAQDEWMRTVYPTLNRADQDAVDAYLAQGGGVPGAPSIPTGAAGQLGGINQMRTGEPEPPTPRDYGSTEQLTYDDYQYQQQLNEARIAVAAGGNPSQVVGELASRYQWDIDQAQGALAALATDQAGPVVGGGPGPAPPLPPYARPGAEPARQPGDQAITDAMLRQILPENVQRTMNLPPYAQQGAQPARGPGDREVPPYAQPGAEPARQPGGYTPQGPPPYAMPGAEQARRPGDYAPVVPHADPLTNAMIAQMIGGGGGPPTLPPYARPGAEPARQPGEIETGERAGQADREGRGERRERAMRELEGNEENAFVLTGGDRTGRRGRKDKAWKAYKKEFQSWLDQKNALYNEDFGASSYRAYSLQQQGITPAMAQLYARQLVPQGMGIVSPGELQR